MVSNWNDSGREEEPDDGRRSYITAAAATQRERETYININIIKLQVSR